MKNVTCNNCGWVHFAVTRTEAEREVGQFNEYFDSLSKEDRRSYGGKKSSIKSYEHCFFCGGPYSNFRPAKDDDCPMGCTIQGIIQD